MAMRVVRWKHTTCFVINQRATDQRRMLSKAFLRTSARGFASKSTPGLKNVVLIDGCRIPFQPCTRLLPAPNRPMALKACARGVLVARGRRDQGLCGHDGV